MNLTFVKSSPPKVETEKNIVYLALNNWDDYSFKTTFYVTLVDSD